MDSNDPALRRLAWQTMIDGVAAPAWVRRYGMRLHCAGLDGVRVLQAEEVVPGRSAAAYDDFFAADLLPQALSLALQRCQPQRETYLTVLDDGAPYRAVLAAAGLRWMAREALMVGVPQPSAVAAADSAVRLISPADDLAALHAADPEPLAWLRSANVADPAQRHYLFSHDGRPAARARSLQLADRAYLTRVFCAPALRGRGFGARLLRRVLHDDAVNGVQHSVLSANLPAVPLYLRLGYRIVGYTAVFALR